MVAMAGEHAIGESCARGAQRVALGAHEGVSEEAVRKIAEIPPAGPGGIFDPMRQAVFLQSLAERPIVGSAARAAGVTTAAVYKMRQRSKIFAAAWDEALTAGVDTLEDRAYDRAMDKSDKLMELLLKGMRPETYRERVDALASMRVNIVVDLVPGFGEEEGDVEGELEDVEVLADGSEEGKTPQKSLQPGESPSSVTV